MKIKILAAAVLLLVLGISGCSQYTGITIQNKKAYLTSSNGSLEVCDVGSDGMLTNCESK